MAEFKSVIKIIDKRPCIVSGIRGERKALFHCWFEKSAVVGLSSSNGEYRDGILNNTFALVEYEDGTVGAVSPHFIRFLDNAHKEYSFGTEDDGE